MRLSITVRLNIVASIFALVFVTAGALPAAELNWPRWRGPQENGHTTETGFPKQFTTADVEWKLKLPGIGQSSPILWGDQIFLTASLERGKERIVLCADRNSHQIVWQHSAWTGAPEESHKMNGWASATCVTDGNVVVAFFGRGGLHAYALDGKPLWSRDLGKFESPWGVASCPIIVGDLVIQNCDADADAHIIALNKKTGKQVWRTPRPEHRGWSTPVVVRAGDHDELVVNGHAGPIGYDPKTGKELWNCKSFNGRGEPTVTPAGDVLCVVNGLPGDFYAVRPGGKGDVTATHMAWHTPRKGGRDCPSPIVIGNYVLVCDMKGVATCYETTKGKEVWKERLGSNYSASPIAADGLAYFVSEDGVTKVIRPGPSFDLVGEGKLDPADDELFRASITPSQGQLFIRSDQVLYCVGKRSEK
ncbi:MAG: PQQ-like beta-propeller repeat protein [Planctomycetes bacterium]|nr:PQQ-like beta-propeller repeat protein [Planctomycetota bacterium]